MYIIISSIINFFGTVNYQEQITTHFQMVVWIKMLTLLWSTTSLIPKIKNIIQLLLLHVVINSNLVVILALK